jgi:hypothetical protein
MPLFLAKVPPRGEGGVADDKDKEIQNLQALQTRYNNDSAALARDLLAENAKLRSERRDLREDLTKATAKVPAEGAVVLTGDDAKAWQTYKEQSGQGAVLVPKDKAAALEAYEKHGTPEVVAQQLESGKVASVEVAQRKRAETLEVAAKSVGFKTGLLKLAAKDLDVQMREVDVTDAEGKTSKVQKPFVVVKDGDKENLTPLVDHFKAAGEDVLADLQDTSGGGGTGGGNNQQQQNNGGGIQFPAQGASKGGNTLNTAGLDNYATTRYGHVLPKAAGTAS